MLDNALFIYMVCLSLHTGVCQVSSPELRVSICYDPGGNSLCFLDFFLFCLQVKPVNGLNVACQGGCRTGVKL